MNARSQRRPTNESEPQASVFGATLSRSRKNARLTLQELADIVGTTKSYLWELENKPTIRPSAELAYRLAKSLGTTIGILLGEDDPDTVSVADLPKSERAFLRDYLAAAPQTRRHIRQILMVLASDAPQDTNPRPRKGGDKPAESDGSV